MNYQTFVMTLVLGFAPAMVQADDNTLPPCGPGMMYGQGSGTPQPCQHGYGPGYGRGMMHGYGRGSGGYGMGPGMMYGPGYGGGYAPQQGERQAPPQGTPPAAGPYMPMHPYGYAPDRDDN